MKNSLPSKKCSMCGKEYKKKAIRVMDIDRYFYVAKCDCEQAYQEQQTALVINQAKEKRILELTNCGWGPRFKDATLQNFKVKKGEVGIGLNECIDYVNDFEKYYFDGRGLILTGPVGCGKTHLLIGTIKELAQQHYSLIKSMHFRTLIDLLGMLKLAMKEDKSEQLTRVFMNTNVLVLDDLGAERLTEWSKEVLYKIINHRYEQRYIILASTNLSVEELVERFDNRIISRLFEMCQGIIMKGADYRRKK